MKLNFKMYAFLTNIYFACLKIERRNIKSSSDSTEKYWKDVAHANLNFRK